MAKTKAVLRTVKVWWRTHAKAERARLYAELKQKRELRALCERDVVELRAQLEKAQIRFREVYAAVREIDGKLELIDWLEMKEEGH